MRVRTPALYLVPIVLILAFAESSRVAEGRGLRLWMEEPAGHGPNLIEELDGFKGTRPVDGIGVHQEPQQSVHLFARSVCDSPTVQSVPARPSMSFGEIGGDVVHVQFQRVGSGFGQFFTVSDPSVVGDSVDAGDHRDIQRRFHRGKEFQVFVQRSGVVVRHRQETVRFTETEFLFMDKTRGLFFRSAYFFLEQRGDDNGGSAGILEFAAAVEVSGERR